VNYSTSNSVIQPLEYTEKQPGHAWWKWVWTVNIFCISATVFLTYYPALPIFHYFNLSGELNFAAWWSGVSLLTAALLGYESFGQTRDFTKSAWLLISCILLALSWDEVGSLHERILQVSWLDYSPYGIAGVVLLTFAFTRLFLKQATRKSAFFLLLGFTLFAVVAVQEYFEHAIQWPFWSWGIRAAIEEGSELLGTFCCLVGLVIHRQVTQPTHSWRILLPNPRSLNLSIAATGCLAIHAVMSLWIPHLSDLPDRGNPALWYPSALYVLLFADAVHQYYSHDKRQRFRLFSAVVWILFSVTVACYKYPWESLGRFWILHTILLIFAITSYWRGLGGSGNILWLYFLPLAIVISILAGEITAVSLMAGVSAYGVARLFLFSPTQHTYKL
jgi:hypothetical protein